MPTSCEITFENPDLVYYAGQMLRGNVSLTLTKEKKVFAIYVRIYGRAHCYFTEINNSNHKSYVGNEYYLDENIYFVGGPNSGEILLNPGTRTYSFQCMLPACRLPTSVEHKLGYITYGACVVLKTPHKPDREFFENFTVINPINLNTNPSFRIPAVGREEIQSRAFGCCCCCQTGPLIVEAYAPVRGYTPGQTINIKITVNNKSDEPVSRFDVELIKTITFFGKGGQSYENGIHSKVVERIITSNEELTGCGMDATKVIYVNLEVPPIPPTDCSTSSIIHVKYVIRIRGSTIGCCPGIVMLDLPVTIGTYPIDDSGSARNIDALQEMVISSQPTAAPLAFVLQTAMTSSPGSGAIFHPSDDPPTYEEAMRLGDVLSGNNFRPKYPMFRRQTSYSVNRVSSPN